MHSGLKHILTHAYKAEMISFMHNHPEVFDEAVRLAVSDKQPYSWRAAWLLWSCMERNDQRIRKYLKEILDFLPSARDNQQRDLLIILQQMELDSDYEGKLFDICMNIWEITAKASSVRYNAIKTIINIARKYPGLSNEVVYLTEPHYLESLSAGTKNGVLRMITSLDDERSQHIDP